MKKMIKIVFTIFFIMFIYLGLYTVSARGVDKTKLVDKRDETGQDRGIYLKNKTTGKNLEFDVENCENDNGSHYYRVYIDTDDVRVGDEIDLSFTVEQTDASHWDVASYNEFTRKNFNDTDEEYFPRELGYEYSLHDGEKNDWWGSVDEYNWANIWFNNLIFIKDGEDVSIGFYFEWHVGTGTYYDFKIKFIFDKVHTTRIQSV